MESKETEKEIMDQVEGEDTTIPIQAGDKVTITLSKQEKDIIDEVKAIKEGKISKKNKAEEEDIVDLIDSTLSLDVPAIDGTVMTIEIPEDADVAADIDLEVDEDTMLDIVTLAGVE